MTRLKIGFSKSVKEFSIFSWLIRWFQGTKFSHIYIRRNSPVVGEYVYQASGTMVNFMGIKYFLSIAKPIEEFEIRLTEEQLNVLIKDFLIPNAGKPYGLKQIIAIVLAEKFGVTWKQALDGDYSYICSEVIVEFLDRIAVKSKFSWGKSPDLVTPKDIYVYLKALELKNRT